MASSEEEGEIAPERVTKYHFVNNREEPISFAILPLQGSAYETPGGLKEHVLLRGTVDNGLDKIYKQVLAWKFDLSYVQPEILVLTKNKNWITLQTPRKSFESIIRTILITVYCLHFVKKNPEASEEAIWNHVVKSFSSYEIKPSENDLVDHIPLIREAAKTDRDLKKSEYLCNILLDKPWKNRTPHEAVQTTKKPNFIVDEGEDDGDEEGDKEEDDLFDHVCAICDNGGELLSCEGRCMRSFHATIEAGAQSTCESLGFSNSQVEALPNFLCTNCLYKRHQCYLCGKLGSSDKSSGAEVFPCVSATCGHFYHPECVAKKLHPEDEAQAKVFQNEIATGESFTCPAHKCFLCKQGEDKTDHELQFAICRRCPKAYHRKCLPKRISLEFSCDESSSQRAWEGLLPNRILIYCMGHKIIAELGTPVRNHVVFPGIELKMKKPTSLLLSSKVRVVEKKRSMVSGNFPAEATAVKISKQIVKDGDSTKSIERKFCRQGFAIPKKPIVTGLASKSLNYKKSALVKPYKSSTGEATLRRVESNLSRSYPLKPKQWHMPSSSIESAEPAMRTWSSSPPLVDDDLEKRMNALIEKTNASFDEEKFRSKFEVASTHSYNLKNVVDKITQGKVDASVKAIRTALKNLEDGGSVEDAKAVCEPQMLHQIMIWKRKLEVYLAPVLHGPRYTSFGRHFTKVEKLEEIVDRLHWYVQSGDMVVDFCCGSNDFSCLMKEKLDEMGKRCSFKNYDLIQPKIDLCFEKRDWMSIHSEELPTGSRLIMGLNPPFGVHAALANKFIDKALKFRPKLLILIVPEETKRLDKKSVAYDLIWKDGIMLSGKSFYLPGSLDVHDKQLEQWNVKTPPLYLWSRPDWTSRHRRIAEEHDHFFNEHERILVAVNGTAQQRKIAEEHGRIAEEHDHFFNEHERIRVAVNGTAQQRKIAEEHGRIAEEHDHFFNEQERIRVTVNGTVRHRRITEGHRRTAEEHNHFFNEHERITVARIGTAQHRRKAEEHKHFFNKQKRIIRDCYEDLSNLVHGVGDISHILDDVPEDNDESGLEGTINSPAKKGKGPSASDDSKENMIEMQCDEKQQKAQSETSLREKLDEEKHSNSNEMDMELSSSADYSINCHNLQGLTNNVEGMETRGRGFCNLRPSSLVHDSKFGTGYEGGTSNLSPIGNMQTFMNEAASSTETVHESLSQGGSSLPCQYPLFHQYGSLPHPPYGYPFPDSTVYSAAYGYLGSAVYNAAYDYASSGAYNAPYGYSDSTDYNPMMYSPIRDMDSSTSDLRPPGVSTTIDYTAPVVVFNATSWAPTEYIDPSE